MPRWVGDFANGATRQAQNQPKERASEARSWRGLSVVYKTAARNRLSGANRYGVPAPLAAAGLPFNFADYSVKYGKEIPLAHSGDFRSMRNECTLSFLIAGFVRAFWQIQGMFQNLAARFSAPACKVPGLACKLRSTGLFDVEHVKKHETLHCMRRYCFYTSSAEIR